MQSFEVSGRFRLIAQLGIGGIYEQESEKRKADAPERRRSRAYQQGICQFEYK